MGFIAYIALKYLAYSAWCFVGLSLLSAFSRGSLSRAFGFGLLRLSLGLMFGLFIYLVGSILYSALIDAPATGLLTYLAIYVPVRWVEWSILGVLLAPSGRNLGVFWMGSNTRDRLWRLGGVLISCVADVPMIIVLGGILPVGRFLC